MSVCRRNFELCIDHKAWFMNSKKSFARTTPCGKKPRSINKKYSVNIVEASIWQ